ARHTAEHQSATGSRRTSQSASARTPGASRFRDSRASGSSAPSGNHHSRAGLARVGGPRTSPAGGGPQAGTAAQASRAPAGRGGGGGRGGLRPAAGSGGTQGRAAPARPGRGRLCPAGTAPPRGVPSRGRLARARRRGTGGRWRGGGGRGRTGGRG